MIITRRRLSPVACGGEADDAEHTIFACSRFDRERMALEVGLGDVVAPNTLLEKIASGAVVCREVMAFIRGVMKTKVNEKLERQRRPV